MSILNGMIAAATLPRIAIEPRKVWLYHRFSISLSLVLVRCSLESHCFRGDGPQYATVAEKFAFNVEIRPTRTIFLGPNIVGCPHRKTKRPDRLNASEIPTSSECQGRILGQWRCAHACGARNKPPQAVMEGRTSESSCEWRASSYTSS